MYEPRDEETVVLYQDDNEECFITIGELDYPVEDSVWEMVMNLFMERDYYRDMSSGALSIQ